MTTSAFDLSCYIEQQGMAALAPLLRDYADGGHYTVINKGPLVPMLQATIGDVLMNRQGGCYALEVKTDTHSTDRISTMFLETWSNKQFAPRKLGWMYTLAADIFWYYFIPSDELYSMSFHRLWTWAFMVRQNNTDEGRGRIYDYPERKQNRSVQLNQSWGRCVPISVIAHDVGCVVYNPSKSLEPVKILEAKRELVTT